MSQFTKPLRYNVTIFSGSESVDAEDLVRNIENRLDGMGVKPPLVEVADDSEGFANMTWVDQ